MKERLVLKIGRILMKLGKLRICIVDDQQAYFNPTMLNMASGVGFTHIERYCLIDDNLFGQLLKSPPDIIILDIKDVTLPHIGKDGLDIASVMYRATNSYVVITSAHQYYLQNRLKNVDYIIEGRILTGVDFIEELEKIAEDYLNKKIKLYKKILFRIGFRLVKQSLSNIS